MQVDMSSFVTAMSVVLNFVLGYLALRPKENESLVSATTMLIKPFQERVAALEKENSGLIQRVNELEASARLQLIHDQENKRTIERLKARVDLLVAQLRASNITPADFVDLPSGEPTLKHGDA